MRTTLHDRFTLAARQDPDRLFELGAELARGHATLLNIACPHCHHRPLTHGPERAACRCGWRGTISEACR